MSNYKDFTKLDEETKRILSALADMYAQYCDRPYGHDFMGAGEKAINILEEYGLADEQTGSNYEKIEELEKLV